MTSVHVFLQEFAITQKIDPKLLTSAWHSWFKKTVSDPVYLEPADLVDEFAKLSFSDLKLLCKERNLPVGKKKVDMIQTLKKGTSGVSQLAQGTITFFLDPQTNVHINSDTGLVIDEKTKRINGYKNPATCSIERLSQDQVEYCRQHNLTVDNSAINFNNTSLVSAVNEVFDDESDIASSCDEV